MWYVVCTWLTCHRTYGWSRPSNLFIVLYSVVWLCLTHTRMEWIPINNGFDKATVTRCDKGWKGRCEPTATRISTSFGCRSYFWKQRTGLCLLSYRSPSLSFPLYLILGSRRSDELSTPPPGVFDLHRVNLAINTLTLWRWPRCKQQPALITHPRTPDRRIHHCFYR